MSCFKRASKHKCRCLPFVTSVMRTTKGYAWYAPIRFCYVHQVTSAAVSRRSKSARFSIHGMNALETDLHTAGAYAYLDIIAHTLYMANRLQQVAKRMNSMRTTLGCPPQLHRLVFSETNKGSAPQFRVWGLGFRA